MRKGTAYTLFILLVTLVLSACPNHKGNGNQSSDIVQKMIDLPEKGGIVLTFVDSSTGKEYYVEAHRLGPDERPNSMYVLYPCKICPRPYPHCCP